MARFALSIVLLFLSAHIPDQCSGCPSDWSLFQENCYQKFDVDTNWDAARIECNIYGADLAIANSQEIMDHLESMGSPRNFYIGLNDIAVEAHFVWVDMTELNATFTPFERQTTTTSVVGNPDLPDVRNDDQRNCVRVKNNVLWKVVPCTNTKAYACSTRNVIEAVSVTTFNQFPYPGQIITLSCNVTVAEGVNRNDLIFQWQGISGNGELVDYYVTTSQDINFQCRVGLNITTFQYDSTPLTVQPLDLPAPTLNITRSIRLFLNNTLESMTCISAIADAVFQTYVWVREDLNEADPMLKFHVLESSVPEYDYHFTEIGSFNLSCFLKIENITSPASENVTVNVIELVPPTVLPQDSRNVFFIGNTYDFVCSSPLEDILDDEEYLWIIDNNSEVVMSSNTISATEFEEISCALRWASEDSEYSSRLFISFIDMPTPTVRPINERFYYVGNTHEFNCSSSLGEKDFLTYPWTVNGTVITGGWIYLDVLMTTAGITEIKCGLQEMNVVAFSETFNISVIEMPQPSLVSSHQGSTYFINHSYNFSCVSPQEEEYFTAYQWKINGSVVISNGGSIFSLGSENVESATISCGTFFEAASAFCEDVDVRFTIMPNPTVVLFGHGPNFFVGNDYSVNCTSTLDGESISSYEWDVNSEYEVVNPESNIMVLLESEGPFHLTCATRFGDVLAESDVETIQSAVVPVPTVEVLGNVGKFVIGQYYTFLCQSDVSTYVTAYTFTNTDQTLPPQSSDNSLVIVVTEDVQEISCTVTVDNAVSAISEEFEVLGSDIISVSAQATNLNPYPGTTVNLTCAATMAEEYTEDDVTFRWQEADDTVAMTKSHTIQVVSGMVTLIFCEASSRFDSEVSNILTIGAMELPKPTLYINNERESGIYEVGYFYTLSCQSEPVEDIITQYRWLRDGQLFEETDVDHLIITAMSTDHDYTCAYRVNVEISVTSELISVTTRSIESAQIENNGDFLSEWEPVAGTSLTLTCQTTVNPRITHGLIYRWFTEFIDVGSSQQYTLTPFPGYRQILRCELIVGDDIVVSEPVIVVAQETPSPPFVLALTESGSSQTGNFQEGNSYTLDCFSKSKSDNSTVTWSKDGQDLLCVTESVIEIKRYRSSLHSGNIQCTIHVSGMESESVVFNLN